MPTFATRPILNADVDAARNPAKSESIDDDELLRRIGLQDAAAFRILVERHVDRAYRLAARVLGSGADAEDVVQDAFLAVWTHGDRWIAGRARFSTWLYSVVTNRCIDVKRRRRTDLAAGARLAVEQSSDAPPDEDWDLNDAVERAIARLPDQQRLAIVLAYRKGLGNREIAERMEMTVMAVESLLKRGRQQLRRTLLDDGLGRDGERTHATSGPHGIGGEGHRGNKIQSSRHVREKPPR